MQFQGKSLSRSFRRLRSMCGFFWKRLHILFRRLMQGHFFWRRPFQRSEEPLDAWTGVYSLWNLELYPLKPRIFLALLLEDPSEDRLIYGLIYLRQIRYAHVTSLSVTRSSYNSNGLAWEVSSTAPKTQIQCSVLPRGLWNTKHTRTRSYMCYECGLRKV